MCPEERKDVLIIIPAYNEEQSIAKVLDGLMASGIPDLMDILVLNDGSDDSTGDIVRAYGMTQITTLYNLGYGSGLQIGYKYAVRRGYDYVIQIDADGQHDVCNIPRLYEALRTADENGRCPDIVIGSRFLEGSECFRISRLKKVTLRMFSAMLMLFTGEKITDCTTGLQGLNRKAFMYYSGFNRFNAKYPDTNMLLQMLLLGYTIREIPAVMHERRAGVSMHAGVIEPVTYMFHMGISMLSVLFRIKVLKITTGKYK